MPRRLVTTAAGTIETVCSLALMAILIVMAIVLFTDWFENAHRLPKPDNDNNSQNIGGRRSGQQAADGNRTSGRSRGQGRRQGRNNGRNRNVAQQLPAEVAIEPQWTFDRRLDRIESKLDAVLAQGTHGSTSATDGVIAQSSSADPATATPALLPDADPDSGYVRAVEPTWYPSDRLYELIDGGDMLYHQAGNVGLAYCSFEFLTNADDTILVYLYHMNDAEAAAEVFDAQRPPDTTDYVIQTLDSLGDSAYAVLGSVYLRRGPYYLQVVANPQVTNDPNDAGTRRAEVAMQLATAFDNKVTANGDSGDTVSDQHTEVPVP